MTSNSSEQMEFDSEEIGNEASQTRQTDVIQVEDMQLKASSTLKPQRVLFDVNTFNLYIYIYLKAEVQHLWLLHFS